MARVVIGLSGGVDSSVAAWLLKEQGHEVVGLFMINWHDTTGTLEGDCPWHDDRVFAELVARKLDIELHVVDLSADYRTRVVDYMFAEYERGRTPNPDVLCNREIKFDVFLREALKLGADYVATGHYCRKAEETHDAPGAARRTLDIGIRMARVVIGLSGGVDSSVAAWLLKEQGHEVVGLFMINWHDTTGTLEGDCPWHDDRVFAELVARKLDIELHVVDLSADYRTRVVDYMFAEYERGRTPNPDVLCNREIKFDVFLREALKLGADYVATGHYCRKAEETLPDGRTIHKLLAGSDPNKDQSYFLCQLSQEQLSRALFPVGGLLKPEVRRIAEEQGLATAKRKDSQGICFVGKVDLPTFLQQKLAPKKGNIHEILPAWPKYVREEVPAEGEPTTGQLAVLAEPWRYTVRDGKKIGEHNGAHYYTIGQRKGLGIGGRRESLFILATDTVQNVIWVGEGDAHPGLWRPALHIAPGEIHWVNPARELTAGQSARFSVRIRYRQPLQGARLFVRDEGAYLVFDRPQRGITPGQFAAWYDGDQLVGSGVIEG